MKLQDIQIGKVYHFFSENATDSRGCPALVFGRVIRKGKVKVRIQVEYGHGEGWIYPHKLIRETTDPETLAEINW